jgi:serine/threonine protein kinase
LNGRVALLNKLLSELDINAALLMDRDGMQLKPANTMLSHQVLASESPIYVLLPLGYTFDLTCTAHQKRVLEPALVIHRHLDNYQYFPFEADGWVGMVMAKSQQEAALLAFDLHPEKLAKPSKENTLRDARNAIWPVPDPRDEDEKITVKQPVRMYAHKQLFDRLKPSKARRSWSGAFELLRRGIDTAKPVAFFEKIGDTTLKQNFYICDFVKTDCNVGQLMAHFAKGNVSFTVNANADAEEAHSKTVTAESVYGQLATYLNTMHSKGVFFRDLSGGNVLVNINARGRLHFSLIDTARARFYNHSISMSQCLDDMTRIFHKLHWSGRKRLMGLYLANIGKKFSLRYQLSFHLYDVKVSLKRTVGRKGIKKLKAHINSLRS